MGSVSIPAGGERSTARVYLNEFEAAAVIGVRPSTLRCWRSSESPRGPRFIKCGRLVKYRTADLHAWMESHLQG